MEVTDRKPAAKPEKKKMPQQSKFHIDWDFIEKAMPSDQAFERDVPPKPKDRKDR
jgi:hypothetical protein